jgi:hypothetical protein
VAPRHQRIREAEKQVVDVVALLGAHFERVAEAPRGEQAEARAAPLDDRIGHQCGAVDDLRHLGEPDAGLGSERRKPLERRNRRVPRRGQALVERNAAVTAVIEDEIREGAADIEADPVVCGHACAIQIVRWTILGASRLA